MKLLNKAMNLFRKMFIPPLLGAILSVPFVEGNAMAEEPKKQQVKLNYPYLFGNTGFEILLSKDYGRFEMENVPLSVRDVPVHPDDAWRKHTDIAPIEDTKLQIRRASLGSPYNTWEEWTGFGGLSIALGAGYKYEPLDIKIGFSAAAFTNSDPTGFHGSLYANPPQRTERNYIHYPGTGVRGYGEALTYYGFSDFVHNTYVYGPFVRMAYLFVDDVVRNRGVKFPPAGYLFMEYMYNLSPFNVYVENGWDRYDELEVRERIKILEERSHRLKVGVGFSGPISHLGLIGDFFVIYERPSCRFTDLGEQIKLNASDGWLWGFGISVPFINGHY